MERVKSLQGKAYRRRQYASTARRYNAAMEVFHALAQISIIK